MSDRVQAAFELQQAEVISTRELGAYCLLVVSNPSTVVPQSGQFFMLSAADGWGGDSQETGRPFLPRALSFFSADSDQIGFLLERVGPGTRALAALATGERLNLLGPLGKGFSAPREGNQPLLVAGGIGVAPVVPLLSEFAELEPAAVLGFRGEDHAAAAKLIPNALVATDDGSVGFHGRVDSLLIDRLQQRPESTVYACGPPAMLESVRAICQECNIDAQLALEAPMACGFGACFGCVVPAKEGYLRVCVDGPVFDAGAFAEGALLQGGH